MPEKKLSGAEVLSVLVERVRRIESDARAVAAVLESMIEKQRSQGKGPEPVAGPGPA